MLLYAVIEVREYLAADGSSPYAKWFNPLNAPAAAKVAIAITRMAQATSPIQKALEAAFRNIASTSAPGYRIYFGRDGDRLVILLGGGTKKRQQKDIRRAQNLWSDYRRRKKEER